MYSKRFERFIGFIKRSETEYKKGHYGDDKYVLVERDPSDPGGTTKWGLDAKTHGEGVAKLEWEEAKEIYWQWYWNGNAESKWNSCEEQPDLIAELLFDSRINIGFKPAQTILAKSYPNALVFLRLREERYRKIVEARPKSKKYLQGWLNRLTNIKKELGIK
jgi:hypothetical protein